jgi:hypothetical protein
MNESIAPSRIDWDENDSKREADAMTFRVMAFDILQMKKTLRVLSLPGKSWLWEQLLAEAFNKKMFRFHGLERDQKVHTAGRRRGNALAGNYKMHPNACTVVSYFKEADRSQTYDIIYLDWMVTWSREKQADIKALFAQPARLKKNGLLMVTLSLTRGQPASMGEIQELAEARLPFMVYDSRGENRHTSNFKVRGIPLWITNAAAEQGIHLRPLMANVYYSNTGISHNVTPQVQLLFKREEVPILG